MVLYFKLKHRGVYVFGNFKRENAQRRNAPIRDVK